jgi:ribonuclease BN (tRNA processing enzyme)
MNHKIESCNKIKLNNPSNWTLQGYSKAGERTGFLINPLKITLDGGVTTSINPIATVITHSHCDHTLNLPTLYTYRNNKVKGQDHLLGRPIYMPKACNIPIQKLMESVILLSDNDPNIPKIDLSIKENIWIRQGYHPIIVKPNDHIPIYGIPNLNLEILHAYHNTETLGYGFYTTKNKLKNEYKNYTQQEIINLKHQNLNIHYEITNYEIVYFCDSTIDNLTLHDEWKKYPVIICECTEFPEKHSIDSKRHHTHLSNLEPIISQNNDKQWILIHTSSAITNDIINKHQQRLRDNNLNVTFII